MARTVKIDNPPVITSAASIVGPKEGEGPLSACFDEISPDMFFGQKTWEAAEAELMQRTVTLAISKAGLAHEEIDYLFSGDLLNQESGSVYGARGLGIPFLGLFGACSAVGMGMGMGAMLISGGFAQHIVANASSHFCGAEKTFRLPLEIGNQRSPTSSWTVTGDGAVVISSRGRGPCITHFTTGEIIDKGQKDANNMGAAMAPAAAHVIASHLRDTGRRPDYYDLIATGDLGAVGSDLLLALLQDGGIDIRKQHADCGLLIYDREKQSVHAGGSGCACCAVTFTAYLYPRMLRGELRRLLFVPTGALHSAVTLQQGETIPGIAHAVSIEI